jgi:outer membrane receptor protein involved in Fe transport
MKMSSRYLALAAAIASQQAWSADAFLHVFFKDTPLQGVEVQLDNQTIGKTDNRGAISSYVEGGAHSVKLTRDGKLISSINFENAEEEEIEISIAFNSDSDKPVVTVRKFAPDVKATATGFVTGRVTDLDGGPLAGAVINVLGADQQVTTDANGTYSIELPRGVYTLEVNKKGYSSANVTNLRIVADLGVSAAVRLVQQQASGGTIELPSTLEEVVVLGSFNPTENAADIERYATSVTDAIDIAQLARYGDSDVAAALTRIVGVSVTDDKYANVRGLDGRYVSSTLNGLLMPSTDPLRRDVQLDLFPSNILGGIEIQKTFSAELLGSTTGGSVKIKTRGLPDEFTHKVSGSIGFNGDFTGDNVSSYRGGSADHFGFDDGLRQLPYDVVAATNGAQNLTVCDPAVDPVRCTSPLDAARMGVQFEDDYSVRQKEAMPDVSLSWSYGDLVELGEGDFGYYAALSYKRSTGDRGEATLTDPLDLQGTYTRTKENTNLNAYFVTGYEFGQADEILSKTILLRNTDDVTRQGRGVDNEDSEVSSTILEWVERQFFSQQFSGSHDFEFGDNPHTLEWRTGFSNTKREEPDRRQYTYLNGQLATSAFERRWSDLDEDSIDVAVDYLMPFEFDNGITLDLKVGALWSDKSRDVELYRFGVRPGDNFEAGMLAESTPLESALTYHNFILDRVRLGVNTTATDSYTADEETQAAYIATTTELEDWTFTLGARWEDFTQSLAYPNEPNTQSSELASDEILPSLGFTYRVTDEIQLRGGFSQTVSYPGLIERSESLSYDPQTDDPIFGNPDLKVSSIDNYDLRAEYYFSDDESISVALFRKEIDQPIERAVPDGSGSAANGITFRNAQAATLDGVEIDAYKNLIDADDYLLFVSGNISYIKSEVELDGDSIRLEGTDDIGRELQGQSPWLANLQFGFDHYETEQKVTLLVNFFDDRIYRVTRGVNNTPEYEKGRVLVDLNYEKLFGESLTFQAQIKNLLNEKVQYEMNDRVIESYEEGTSLSLKLEYQFQ